MHEYLFRPEVVRVALVVGVIVSMLFYERVQLTTGGSPRLTVEERMNTITLGPEMASLNMGLLNFFIRGEQVFFSSAKPAS